MKKYSLELIQKIRYNILIVIIQTCVHTYCQILKKLPLSMITDMLSFYRFIFKIHPSWLASIAILASKALIGIRQGDSSTHNQMVKSLLQGSRIGGWWHRYVNKNDALKMITDIVNCSTSDFIKKK